MCSNVIYILCIFMLGERKKKEKGVGGCGGGEGVYVCLCVIASHIG